MSITDYFKVTTKNKDNGKKITIFTDGACVNNGKRNAKGGVGIYYQDNHKPNVSISLKDSKPTNNKAELTAIKMAIESCEDDDEIIIYTDSEYAINCITKWAPGWELKNWTRKGKEVANKDLIRDILYLYRKRNVLFKHVRSHQQPPENPELYKIWYGNMMADKLAFQGISAP